MGWFNHQPAIFNTCSWICFVFGASGNWSISVFMEYMCADECFPIDPLELVTFLLAQMTWNKSRGGIVGITGRGWDGYLLNISNCSAGICFLLFPSFELLSFVCWLTFFFCTAINIYIKYIYIYINNLQLGEHPFFFGGGIHYKVHHPVDRSKLRKRDLRGVSGWGSWGSTGKTKKWCVFLLESDLKWKK